jgi:hypothetical protein
MRVRSSCSSTTRAPWPKKDHAKEYRHRRVAAVVALGEHGAPRRVIAPVMSGFARLSGMVAVMAGFGGAVPPTAHAYPVHRRMFTVEYGRPAGCVLCHGHGGGTERNPYGEAWHVAGESMRAFRAIARADSDGDGHANSAEIEGGSNPGAPESVPGSPGDTWTRSLSEVFIPLEQLELVFDAVERVDALEVELTAAQAAEIEALVGSPLRETDRLPTLYFKNDDGTRTAVAMFQQVEVGAGIYSMLVSVQRDGTVGRVALFRSPREEGHRLLPYLACLRGASAASMPAPGDGACPRIGGMESAQRAIRDGVTRVLHVVKVVLSGMADGAAATDARVDVGAAAAPGATATAGDSAVFDTSGRGELPLDAPEATASTEVLPVALAQLLVALSVLAMGLTILASARWAAKRGEGAWPALGTFPGPARLAVLLVTTGLMLTQTVAVVDAYVQTQVVHGSTWEYFQHVSQVRLLGTSHAHLFGYTLTYGILAVLVTMTRASRSMKAALVAALLVTGPFDVLSWWGQKALSPAFDWLTVTCGAVLGTASLVAALWIVRDAGTRG